MSEIVLNPPLDIPRMLGRLPTSPYTGSMLRSGDIRNLCTALAAAEAKVATEVRAFTQAVLHGDADHREWLTAAAEAWIARQPLPPPNGLGRAEAAEAKVAELQATIDQVTRELDEARLQSQDHAKGADRVCDRIIAIAHALGVNDFVFDEAGYERLHDRIAEWKAKLPQSRSQERRFEAMEQQSRRAEEHLSWAISRWRAEVENRPVVNIYRRTLDETWRQVIRYFGGDDVAICEEAQAAKGEA